MRPASRRVSAVTLTMASMFVTAVDARGASPVTVRQPGAGSTSVPPKRAGRARSPQAGPLIGALPAQAAEESGAAPAEPSDPLVTNGLGSPSCRSTLGAELDSNGQRDCQTSGFIAAPAPTDDYGLDVHIDTGLLPLSGASLLSTVQSVFVTPEWLGAVWLVHATVVMLEWAFAVDLLDFGAAPGLAAGLARAEATLTTPLLALALSISAVLVAYHGLVRRRVAQTLGEAALTLAMFAGGLWLMLDPSGTVGSVGRLSDRAALGVLAVAADGSPAVPGRALGTHLGGLFSAAVEGPWCYLEFGNVAWCRERRRLEAPLRDAALRLAAREDSEARCGGAACGSKAGLRKSARMLREARTNGELFLALPPNGPARNSINDEWSLYRTLCGGSQATDCPAPGASEAEFRTNGGTWPRVSGLVLILVGLSGMLLLFGYVAMRLLTAAVMGVLFLLMAPGVVLAPALGEWGRGLFRAWLTRLFGAVVAKFVFAFLLGALFASTALIESLSVLGWWAQWLLLGAFWWTAFLRRHDLLALAPGLPRDASRITRSAIRRTFVAREATERVSSWRERRRKRAERIAAEDLERARTRTGGGPALRTPARTGDAQALRLVEAEVSAAPSAVVGARRRIQGRSARLQRLEAEAARARSEGRDRRAVSLELRAERLRAATADDERVISGADRIGQGGEAVVGERLAGWSRRLDAQATLRGSAERRAGPSRDYPSLAGLANLSAAQYANLGPREQRVARLKIDRELTARRERLVTSEAHERRTDDDPAGGRAFRQGQRESPASAPVRRRHRPPVVRSGAPDPGGREESAVMRDARAVAEGRKRQLGYDRP